MRILAVVSLFMLTVMPGAADTVVSEVSGTWDGSKEGAFFARLSKDDDHWYKIRLQIWPMTTASPTAEMKPALDNPDIALGASLRQNLAIVDRNGTYALQIVTEFMDETSAGTTILEIQYLDNQYKIVGFSDHDQTKGDDSSACELNFLTGTAVQNGAERKLPNLTAADLDASKWTYDAPFERGYCNISAE